MNTRSKLLGIYFVAFTAIQLYGQGYIVPNGISDLGSNGYGYEIHITQNPVSGDYTGFLFHPIIVQPPRLPDPNLFILIPFLVLSPFPLLFLLLFRQSQFHLVLFDVM